MECTTTSMANQLESPYLSKGPRWMEGGFRQRQVGSCDAPQVYGSVCQSSVSSDERVNCFRIRSLFKNALDRTVDHKQRVKWKHVCNIFTLESMGTI